MRLVIKEVLDYYDVPQLFVAQDNVLTSYLCLTYDIDEEGVLQCVAVNISPSKLNNFLTGHIDLKEIFLNPELNRYDVLVDGDDVDARLRDCCFEDRMLPDEGYRIDFAQIEDRDMIRASREENRTILRIAYNYESTNHTISSKILTNTVSNFQTIISKAYRRINRGQEEGPSLLYVRAPIAASFDLEFMTGECSDLFGSSKVADTLEMIKPLFSDLDDEVADCLANFKDVHSYYKSLVKELSDNELSFKFKWVQSSTEYKVSECKVSKELVPKLYSLASSIEPLDDSTETIEGSFFMANTKNGRWGFAPSTGSRLKYGTCLEKTKLHGIILNKQLYRITCTVSPSRNPITGKEYRTYILTDIVKV